MTRLKLETYAPFPDLPPVEPGAFGPVYEIRSYVLKTGGLCPPSRGGRKSSLRARSCRG